MNLDLSRNSNFSDQLDKIIWMKITPLYLLGKIFINLFITINVLTLSKTKVGSLDFDLAGKNQFNTGDVADCLQSSADQRRAGQHRETSR